MTKYILVIAVMLTITSCGEEEEPTPECLTGARLVIGENTNHCGVMSRFSHRLNRNGEIYSLFLSYFPYGNMDMSLDPKTTFEEGVTYERGEGAGFSPAHLGGINSASITIEKVDRENQLLTISFQIDGTVLENNTRFEMSGTLEDMPLTEELTQ